MLRRLLWVCGLIACGSVAALANPVDPFIGLDDPSPCSNGAPTTAISLGGTFALSPNGGGVNCFYNSTTSVITDISFQAEVGTGLTNISSLFSCSTLDNGVVAQSFFKTCTLGYDSVSGLLTIEFSGVNPSDNDEGLNSTDPETGPSELEGIPTLMAGCASHPDSGFSTLGNGSTFLCASKGNFLVTLNDNFSESGNTGGWDNFVPAGQGFQIVQLNGATVPEPSTMVVLGAGLVLMGGFARRRLTRRG
jgi:hypothetical protein